MKTGALIVVAAVMAVAAGGCLFLLDSPDKRNKISTIEDGVIQIGSKTAEYTIDQAVIIEITTEDSLLQ